MSTSTLVAPGARTGSGSPGTRKGGLHDRQRKRQALIAWGFALPFVAVFAIMYFLIIRPQRTQMKKREEMLKNIRRGDTVVTGGGIIGKVTKVLENGELEVQISEQTRVRLVQAMVSDVRVKGEPAAANQK